MSKITPLYKKHLSLSARMVEFAGWNMPLLYNGVIVEHQTVRNNAGLFDVSHMGEIEIRGSDSIPMLQRLLVGDIARMSNGKILYSLMCTPSGGIIDDLLVYRFSDEHFMLCVNASNSDKDYAWILKNSNNGVSVTDIGYKTAQLALQGSKAEQILKEIFDIDLPSLRYYEFRTVSDREVMPLISRTGYTGEDGFEIYIDSQQAEKLWDRIMSVGEPYGIMPVGIAARDTLRLEMKYPLYGNDLSETTTPIEAGLGWAVKLNKGDFIGSGTIQQHKKEGVKRRLVGFEMVEKGIPRTHYYIYNNKNKIGEVTSGTHSPSLNKGIGIGYIDTEYSDTGSEIEIEIRSRRIKAVVVKTPFYTTHVKK